MRVGFKLVFLFSFIFIFYVWLFHNIQKKWQKLGDATTRSATEGPNLEGVEEKQSP